MSQYKNRTRRYSPSNPHRSRSRFSASSRVNQSKHGQYIDPARFVKVAKPLEQMEHKADHQFSDFVINKLLQDNLASNGYVSPSAIQDKTIGFGLEGKDIIGIANTGTGKTAAFALPILNRLMGDKFAKALVIAPTRELAQQIEQECRKLAKNSGLNGAVLIGGAAIGPQLRDLRNNPRIVIGTPGRIKDHLERRSLDLSKYNLAVIDEVDRLLDMGFVKDVTSILSKLSEKRQLFFFSATIDRKVSNLIQTFSNQPVTISIKTSDTSENVHQDVIKYVSPYEKLDKLHDILIQSESKKILVFDETQRNVERLNKELLNRGFVTDAIHGGKSQGQRQRALERFKKSEVDVLVATDVAARGIDVTDITHVINYTVPKTFDDYIHRIGRTGRAGRIGQALTFVAQ